MSGTKSNSSSSTSEYTLKPAHYDPTTALTRSKSSTSIDSLQISSLIQQQQQQQQQYSKKQLVGKNLDVLSLVLKAEPTVSDDKRQDNQLIHLHRASINPKQRSTETALDQSVLFEFIVNNLKKQLIDTSVKSSFLNLNLICKVKKTEICLSFLILNQI